MNHLPDKLAWIDGGMGQEDLAKRETLLRVKRDRKFGRTMMSWSDMTHRWLWGVTDKVLRQTQFPKSNQMAKRLNFWRKSFLGKITFQYIPILHLHHSSSSASFFLSFFFLLLQHIILFLPPTIISLLLPLPAPHSSSFSSSSTPITFLPFHVFQWLFPISIKVFLATSIIFSMTLKTIIFNKVINITSNN